MKKQILCLYVSLLLVSCCLFLSVGCGDSPTPTTTTSTTGTSTASTTSTSIVSTTTTTTSVTTTTNNDQAYFPNTNGYSWKKVIIGDPLYYETSTFDGTVVISPSITAQKLKQNTTYNGTDFFTGEVYYVVDSTGVYTYGTLNSPTTEATVVLSFPLTVGRTWTRSSYSYMTTEATIVSRESVSVAAGTFDCYKIAYVNRYPDSSTSTDYFWYGLNAGQVKVTNDQTADEFNLNWKNF
ncbi:MAG: hypothetical protein WC890_02140 [Candidatus Margulisiibacteriota bacterium]